MNLIERQILKEFNFFFLILFFGFELIYGNFTTVAKTRLVKNETAKIQTLKFVHALWRHGDRTPSIIIPTDTGNNITTWKLGLGELTKEGMAQQFRLGKYIRKRYNGFLSNIYSPFEIYYRSSDYNRTLVSAQANLAALFFPGETERFFNNFTWRPIPVHTMPKEEDKLLFDKAFCPNADAEENNVYSSQEVKTIEKENEDFLRFIAIKSGYQQVPIPFRNLWLLFDPLNSEYCHPDEHKLPDWVDEKTRKKLWSLYDLSSAYLMRTPLLVRLRGGPLFNDILNRMKSISEKFYDSREKFYAYSGHDTSIAFLMAAFGIHLKTFPKYASVVFVELHQNNKNDEYYVKLFYKNETDGTNLLEYDIPNCEEPCTLDKLEKSHTQTIPLNWKEECGIYNNNNWRLTDQINLIIIVIMLILCFILLIEIIIINRKIRQKFSRKEVDVISKRLLLDDADDEDLFSR